MRRREFLAAGSRATLGIALLPAAGCAHARKEPIPAKDNRPTALGALVRGLETQIPLWMQESKVPGLAIAVIEEAKLAWRRGFGCKDNDSKEAVDNSTMFEAGSMSKPVFAYRVLKLCEKGALNLDTPLTKLTSERFLEGDPRLDLITARHVLSHTTGFQNWRSEKERLKIHFTPGEKWLYSGEGYYYLQSVVTHLTGHVNPKDCARFEGGLQVCATDFDASMKANLLGPLGMRSSEYLWDDRFTPRMARPHDHSGKPMANKRSTGPAVARYGSSGALLTTPTDYAKFVMAVIDPGPSDAFRLNKASVHEMIRPHVKLEGPYPNAWALGWEITHLEERELIYHGGDNDGFHCGALASVDGQCGYVMMTNGDNGPEILKKLIESDLMRGFLLRKSRRES